MMMRCGMAWVAATVVLAGALVGCSDGDAVTGAGYGGAGASDAGADGYAGGHAGAGSGSHPDAPACTDDDLDGWSTCDGDCLDSDPRANPGVTEPRLLPRVDGSYDLDCDGAEEPANAKALACGGDGGTTDCTVCAYHTGYWLEVAPACGRMGTWVVSCSEPTEGDTACECVLEERQQACR